MLAKSLKLIIFTTTPTPPNTTRPLIRIQLPEKYKENFDVTSEGPSLGS
jgi:hypothetical protein